MYKTIDLFAGIGGIRRGFEMTGFFSNILSAEIDQYACITYEHLFGENPLNDVTSEEFKEKTVNSNYDILLAGFPCQSFSIAGKKQGFEDKTRGTLFFDIADIINRTKPIALFLENVEGLTTHDKGNTFKTIIEVLTIDLGYHIVGVKVENDLFGNNTCKYDKTSFVRNTKNFGLPQKRSRTYIIGFRKDIIPNNYIFPNIPQGRTDLNLYNNLNDLLELNAKKEFYVAQGYLNTLKKHRARHSKKGNGFGFVVVNSPDIENPISNTVLATGGSGKERNLVFDPQENIAGTIVKNKKTPLNDESIRHMTPREWGKLQGFINYAFVNSSGIDEFSFPPSISKSQQYKQFGNSVSIPVIESIANYLKDRLIDFKNLKEKDETFIPKKVDYLIQNS